MTRREDNIKAIQEIAKAINEGGITEWEPLILGALLNISASIAIIADAMGSHLGEQPGRWMRLFSYINDKRLAIAPDELTPDGERAERQGAADALQEILDIMIQIENGEG